MFWMLRQAQLGKAVADELAEGISWAVPVFYSMQVLFHLLAFIAFVRWFYRAYQNVHRLPQAKPDYRADMALWSWFIPLINVWFPYKIMLEIGHYVGQFSHPRSPALSSRWDFLVVGWVVLDIAVFLAVRAILLLTPDRSTLDELLRANQLLMATQVIFLLRALATIALLRLIAPHEQQLFAAQAAGSPAPAASSTPLLPSVTE